MNSDGRVDAADILELVSQIVVQVDPVNNEEPGSILRTTTCELGDINFSGEVNNEDLAIFTMSCLSPWLDKIYSNGDVDGDGFFTILDLGHILVNIVGGWTSGQHTP